MEIIAHTLWTTAGARKLNLELGKKNSKHKFNLFWTAFFGIFPDLFAFTWPFVLSFWEVIMGAPFDSLADRHHVADGFGMAHNLYQYSHSLIIFILVFTLVWVIIKRPPLVLLGWVFHILLDIPSHSVGFYPTPFLFPISDYHFPYGVAWGTPWSMIVNYIMLGVVWGIMLYNKYYKKVK